jgi:hypothetical protein
MAADAVMMRVIVPARTDASHPPFRLLRCHSERGSGRTAVP